MKTYLKLNLVDLKGQFGWPQRTIWLTSKVNLVDHKDQFGWHLTSKINLVEKKSQFGWPQRSIWLAPNINLVGPKVAKDQFRRPQSTIWLALLKFLLTHNGLVDPKGPIWLLPSMVLVAPKDYLAEGCVRANLAEGPILLNIDIPVSQFEKRSELFIFSQRKMIHFYAVYTIITKKEWTLVFYNIELQICKSKIIWYWRNENQISPKTIQFVQYERPLKVVLIQQPTNPCS